MNDPEAIRFVNEVIRPLCEEARGLGVRLAAMRTAWFLGQNAHFSDAGEAVEDGREDDGASRLTCGDVTNAVAQLLKTAAGEAGAWNSEIIQKPCIRMLP